MEKKIGIGITAVIAAAVIVVAITAAGSHISRKTKVQMECVDRPPQKIVQTLGNSPVNERYLVEKKDNEMIVWTYIGTSILDWNWSEENGTVTIDYTYKPRDGVPYLCVGRIEIEGTSASKLIVRRYGDGRESIKEIPLK